MSDTPTKRGPIDAEFDRLHQQMTEARATLDHIETLYEMEVAALREATIEECAKVAEAYPWVDDDNVQSPDEHQAALAQAIRALKGKP